MTEFAEEIINEAFENNLILRDPISYQIMNKVCKEMDIPIQEFANLIIWAYQNRKSNMTGVNTVIDELLNKMD